MPSICVRYGSAIAWVSRAASLRCTMNGARRSARGARCSYESRMGSFDPCWDAIAENLLKKNGIPAADQPLDSAFNTVFARPLLPPFPTLRMKPITSVSAFILLQIAVLPCCAKSGRRSNPPALENISLPSTFNGVNTSLCVMLPLSSCRMRTLRTDILPRIAGPADPPRKILSKVPYDEKIGGLTLRIMALKGGPFISSFNLLPCMVDMLRSSFDAIWLAPDQQMNLHDNRYLCSENSLTLDVLSHKPPLKTMEYSDLVMLGQMLLNFQQGYMLPGIEFQFLSDKQVTGTGSLSYNQAANDLNQE